MIMKKLYFLLTICLFTSPLVIAQGWELFFTPEPTGAAGKDIVPTLDGNYVVNSFTPVGLNGDFGVVYRKFSDDGQVLWERVINDAANSTSYINNLSDNAYITFGTTFENIAGVGITIRPKVLKFDQNGETVWEATFLFPGDNRQVHFRKSFPLENGNFIFSGYKNASASAPSVSMIGEISGNDGTLLWERELSFFGTLEQIKENGDFIFSERMTGVGLIRNIADSSGSLISSDTILEAANSLLFIFEEDEIYLASRGNSILADQTQLKLRRLDANLTILAEDSILMDERLFIQGFKFLDNQLAITGYTATQLPQAEEVVKGIFMTMDLAFNVLFTKLYQRPQRSHHLTDVVRSNQSGYILTGGVTPGPIDFGTTMRQMYIFKTDNQGNIYNNIISGSIAIDGNEDCLIDGNETPADNWIVTAHKPGLLEPFGTVTDALGAYELPVDTGNYIVHLTPQSDIWESCNNDTPVSFTEFQQSETVDFPITATTDCPAMVVSLAAPLVRPCLARPVYLTYCNAGNITATDAYLEVALDPLLTPVSASVPWDNLSGDNLLTWEIGDLDPLACRSISFMVELDCDAEVGLSYCMDAHIFPDTLCTSTSSSWSGAFLEVTGSCINDEVNFEIRNIGTSTMLEQSNFIIVEDAVLRESGQTDLLAPNMGNTIPLEGNGSTFTLLVNQVPNAPGNSNPMAVVEGCGTNDAGEFSINFSNQFPLDDYQLVTDTECPIAVNSFDPNDKNAKPIGFTAEHYIEPETPLEYTIRFQNTGTDTAYLVVIRDTLSEWLDITTFQKGLSSHPYELGLTNQGHLSFTFYGIALPDSAANQAASNGFVDFKITPLADTPVETLIQNLAAIYFDYNEPVITNQTYHRIIGDYSELLVNTVSHPLMSGIEVSVSPNPFQNFCVFQIKNHEAHQYQLEIFNTAGILIRSELLDGNHLKFENQGINAGLYFYRLSADDGFLSTGRLIVK